MKPFSTLIATSVLTAGLLSTPAFAGTLQITQKGRIFSEKRLALSIGDQLDFLSDDDVVHNIIVSSRAGADDKGLMQPGERISHVFDANGRFRVACAIHPKMKMAVTVE